MSDEVWVRHDKRWYRYIGMGFGAQLESLELRRPPAGTQRRIGGVRFTVFQTHRVGLRVRASWGCLGWGDLDRHNRELAWMHESLFGGRR